jgi:hypothetical protein
MPAPGRLSIEGAGQQSSVMIIPLCSAPAAVVTAGPRKTDGSINAIAGDQRASTARQRLGMDSRAPSAAASRT